MSLAFGSHLCFYIYAKMSIKISDAPDQHFHASSQIVWIPFILTDIQMAGDQGILRPIQFFPRIYQQ